MASQGGRGALKGIRVLEWGRWHAVPAAAVMLADMGADVIKIDDTVTGDPSKGIKTILGVPVQTVNGFSYWYEWQNRSKRSIAVDLKKERGRAVVYELIKKSDVFMTNFVDDVVSRCGMQYEKLCQYNPGLIWVGASGFGHRGPDRSVPSYDYSGQARSGIMVAQRNPDEVPFSPLGFGDQSATISTVIGVLAALVARIRIGIGQEIRTSLLGGLISLQSSMLSIQLTTGEEIKPVNRNRQVNPLWNVYQCKDKKWICLAMLTYQDRYWPLLCRALGIQELERDPQFSDEEAREKNGGELIAILDRVFATRSQFEWSETLKAYGLIYSVVNRISDLEKDPQVIENDYIVEYDHPVVGKIKAVGCPIYFSETPPVSPWPAPQHGKDTEEILMEVAGYGWDEIDELKREGAIL